MAQKQFAVHGYSTTSVRAITSEAGVDAAMVRHHFGGKKQLYREAVLAEVEATIDALIASLQGRLGASPRPALEVVRGYFDLWEAADSAQTFSAVLRSAWEDDDSRRALVDLQATKISGALASLGWDAVPRPIFTVAMSQLLGVALTRYVIQMEPVAELDRTALDQLCAVTMESLIGPYLSGSAGHLRSTSST
ncbi:TetR/AcrR family transcriptional regulator [Kocuria sp.]|uniref:TetR/AcrR family transcriptional regulator n=1 Tax=Kocuria sp. TaxID=1871328 RepID=UPI0026E0BC97|nr:TetR/AcrR family transcriptional regulator [Kocuria sp.]MDO5617643.1 TetR family transcriptional regulator [Kocuria sp.]